VKTAKTARMAFNLGRRTRVVPMMARARMLIRGRRGLGMTLLGGIGTGATLMYFFDPNRGTRRRALARNKAAHLMSAQRQFLAKSGRDARHRGSGLIARFGRRAHGATDEILVARVRAEMGRHVSHASSIDVEVEDGIVTLTGPVFHDEVRGLMRAIHRVPGVKAVHNELEMHDQDDRVPGLQGEGRVPRPVFRREHWPPAHRLASAGTGLTATLYGLARGGVLGGAVFAGGTALLLRAVLDRPLRDIFGLSAEPTVTIQKSVTVDAPIGHVWDLWSNPENFPLFMEHVVHVDTEPDGRTSHWRATGPAGTPLHWDAQLVEAEPHERLGWRTTGGTLAHAGEVRFERVGDRTTRVHVRMAYAPPVGYIGHSIASLLGQDPKHALDDDLVRMKSLLEEGKTTVRGQTMEAPRPSSEPPMA
jgi:uncharacterized membrane protein